MKAAVKPIGLVSGHRFLVRGLSVFRAANTGNDLTVLRIAAILGVALSVSACDQTEKPDLTASAKPAKVRKAQVSKATHIGEPQYSALATAVDPARDDASSTLSQPRTLPLMFRQSDDISKAIPSTGGKPYGLQTAYVRDGCLKPGLVGILAKVKAHYGVEPIVTSGCRHGRGRSLHNSGNAVDIIVPGVGPDALIRYVRTIPEVGGTGRYGHNKIVHVDLGAKRQWSTVGGRWRFAMLSQ